MDVSIPPALPPPPPTLHANSTVPRFDSSVPPPAFPSTTEIYQNWALQWQYFQQAQAAAAYQTQYYQSLAQQNKPAASHFRPRQAAPATPNRARFSAPSTTNTSSNFQSYNNVPPPASLTANKPAQPAIRFHLNTRPTAPSLSAAAAASRPAARRSRFSSPPKTNDNRAEETRMDTSESQPSLTAIEAYKLALDKSKWPQPLKYCEEGERSLLDGFSSIAIFRHYWQLIEARCTTALLRSQADEWIQTALADAFQKHLVHTTDWMNKPLPE